MNESLLNMVLRDASASKNSLENIVSSIDRKSRSRIFSQYQKVSSIESSISGIVDTEKMGFLSFFALMCLSRGKIHKLYFNHNIDDVYNVYKDPLCRGNDKRKWVQGYLLWKFALTIFQIFLHPRLRPTWFISNYLQTPTLNRAKIAAPEKRSVKEINVNQNNT